MCLIAFALKIHPQYPLVLIANRDEYYYRPTERANFWPEEPQILGGKDLQGGGTWLSIHQKGRWGALTNFREPGNNQEQAPSRGELIPAFLSSTQSPSEYLKKLQLQGKNYNGFNLLVGIGSEIHYYSNRQKEIQSLSPGIYGLSNHLLNTPWPKVERTKEALGQLLQESNPLSQMEKIWEILADKNKAPQNKLPHTGLPQELEEQLSSPFIATEHYGTRCSTLLAISHSGQATLWEKTHPIESNPSQIVKYQFSLELS